MATPRALVLARGLGTRMRSPDPGAVLNEAQQRAAQSGLKALMPIGGRAFLDYVLSALADAGVLQVGVIVAPEHAAIADYYADHAPQRVALSLIVQQDALGTANALIAGAPWTSGDPFLAMNADNLYPVAALAALASQDEPAFAAFDAADLVRTSNIPASRIAAFALAGIDEAGYLCGIVEKPARDPRPAGAAGRSGTNSDSAPSALGRRTSVSMNLWRFDSRIFDACASVPRSARGEYELPEAVGVAVRSGMRIRAVPSAGPVLDLSRRADAADVERRLSGVVPRP
jgi:dTDP-glucose pyrophosphorylase